MSDILDRYVVEKWDGDGRSEVQASWNEDRERYEVRVCAYQPNGRFAQYPPHVSPDEESVAELVDGIAEMAERARHENLLNELGELSDLIEQVGSDRARKVLEEAADAESERASPDEVDIGGRAG
jgi:hypothetical protein